jgi:enoyl-CoA hydratase/carnithine racemase
MYACLSLDPARTLEKVGVPLTEQSPKVIFATRGRVCYITINRPEVLNACDFETYAAIQTAFKRFDADPALAVAIFTGVGERAFCAGSDIKSNFAGGGIDKLDQAGDTTVTGDKKAADGVGWHIGQVSKIVICGINGHANGGGLEQAIASDIRVAVRSAQLGLGEVRLGLLPGGGGTQRLPRLIPKGRAIEMLVTGNRIGAEEGLRLGIIDHVVSDLDELMEKCEAIAEEVALSAPIAVQVIKRVAMAGLDTTMEEGLQLEAEGFAELTATDDSREGTNAFAEKRLPQWKGR